MAADPDDRLSALPDDLLLRILGFAPAREVTSTAVLSRRWRGLWLKPAPAVILDTRSYNRMRRGGVDDLKRRRSTVDRCDIDRDAFFRDAEAALAAHGPAGVRSLAVYVEANNVHSFMSQYQQQRYYEDDEDQTIAANVLAHPACRAVEELTIKGSVSMSMLTARRRAYCLKKEESQIAELNIGNYNLSLGSVPSEALHLLQITNSGDLTLPRPPTAAAAVFPCLATLRLQRCSVSLCTLQSMIDASPQLFKLQLECVHIKPKYYRPTSPDNDGEDHGNAGKCFCCPGITSLVLVNCSWKDESLTIELGPRLRSFRYRGLTSQSY
jgi:hypothetical protein